MLHRKNGEIWLNDRPIKECSSDEIYTDAKRHLKEYHEEMYDVPPYRCLICDVYYEWLSAEGA